jgi:predicted ATP-dependent endonuclease of OLD family
LDLNTKFKGISKSINREIIFENETRDDIKLDELSTGEQQLFIRALNLKMMDLKDSVILIDEPELSLHPNWQNQILKIYQNIANQGDNQLIVATHSPQIISSTPNQSLRILIKNGKNIEVKQVDNSYGIEIDEVLQDLMGTKYLRTPPIAKEIKRMWNYLNSGDLNNFEK